MENQIQNVHSVEPKGPQVSNVSPWMHSTRKTLLWSGIGLLCVIAVGWWFLRGGHASTGAPVGRDRESIAGIPVKTTHPAKKTLKRLLTLPVSIKASAQAELYAKTSGYLKFVQREGNADDLARSFASALKKPFEPYGSPTAWCLILAERVGQGYYELPQKDIGSRVVAGECLLEVDNPEPIQDIAEKASILMQRKAEYESAEFAIRTIEASVESMKAQRAQAETDIMKCREEHTFRSKQLNRLESLVRDGTIVPEILDEKQFQTKAALSAWESSKAKLAMIDAEINVVSSKLATARADLKTRDAMVQVARDGLARARAVAAYGKILAPFDGIITYRGVDAGDFIQNSTSGSTRPLMTVCAIDHIRFVAQVPERDAPWVKPGKTEVSIHDIDALEGFELKACVARTSHSLDPSSRTMQVEIEVENEDGHLLPGMYGQMTLTLQSIENAIAIPATAVNSRKGMNFIILVKDGIARHQPVRITYDDGRELQVLKRIDGREVPLTVADELVVSNKGEIADGQQVHSVK